MARKHFAQLQRIEHDHEICEEQDAAFLRILRYGLLLALQEYGFLNQAQLLRIEEQLGCREL